MFESLGLDTIGPRGASVWLALGLGLLFGLLAERTGFCFRRSLVGADRRAAAGVWAAALLAALLGTQAAVAAGWIGFGDHRFHAASLPVLAIGLGGLMFGAGMVLARGCMSRLTVLGGTGNLRALTVLLVFALTAQATLKGVLAPLRSAAAELRVDLGTSVTLPGAPILWTLGLGLVAALVVLRSGNRPGRLILAALLGALVPLGWVGTGFVLYDDFDPIALESLSFTAPAADTLFWTAASTAVPAGFGTGLIGGTLAGSLLAALVFGSFRWQSFESPRQTGRYVAGAVLMGIGGVLAGGCTVGAGLSGLPTLSVSAALALAAIAAGALATHALVDRVSASPSARGSGGSSTTRALQPAE